jgi:hypothetical protein
MEDHPGFGTRPMPANVYDIESAEVYFSADDAAYKMQMQECFRHGQGNNQAE